MAAQLEEATYTEGSVIYEQNKKADSFFLIYKGTVRLISLQKGKERNISKLVARDYFGYLDIRERRARTGTATALTDTVLLYLSRENFDKLRKSSANFRSNLDLAVRTRKLARSLQFKWLGPDETIYFLARKHPIILVRNLLLPFLAMFVPAILLYWWVASAPSLIVLMAASLSLLFNILWAVWLILDWGNDYYVVTNKRVVWLEKVIVFTGTGPDALLTKMNSVPAPLWVILVDHGGPEKFYLGADWITPADLNTWLNNLETGLTAPARLEKRVIVIGACYSGSFIPALTSSPTGSDAGRIIITSATSAEESYKGPLEPDNIRSGEFFLEEFFKELAKGTSIKVAFQTATESTRAFTSQGGGSANLRQCLRRHLGPTPPAG